MIELFAGLERRASAQPGHPAFTGEGEQISYGRLLRRVAGAAAALGPLPNVLGLLAEDSIDWVVADLAASAAGKTLVPIPAFFSRDQMSHLIADAGISHVLTNSRLMEGVQSLGLPCSEIPQSEASSIPNGAEAQRIVYTSGSTGRPKGVRLAGRQIGHSVMALATAIQASAADVHLSVLPFAMLLEQICGIYLVIHAGATSHIAAGAAESCTKGDAAVFLRAFTEMQPSTTVLVPQLMAALAAGYAASGAMAPESLRFVAVGGAPVSPRLLEAAWRVGIPACVGYGLSECCSVVSVSRPGSRSFTAGPPLPGVNVAINRGEIVVSGPTVMQGYLGGEDPRGYWRTGDIGYRDKDGNLVVVGRKDNLLVTPNGRNISPEWIEVMIERDPRIGRCVVICNEGGKLTAIVTPGKILSSTVNSFEHRAASIVLEATRPAPDYAKPAACMTTSEQLIVQQGLLNGKGEPNRAGFARYFNNSTNARHRITGSLEFSSP